MTYDNRKAQHTPQPPAIFYLGGDSPITRMTNITSHKILAFALPSVEVGYKYMYTHTTPTTYDRTQRLANTFQLCPMSVTCRESKGEMHVLIG